MRAAGAARTPSSAGSRSRARGQTSSSAELPDLLLMLVRGLKEQTEAIHRLAASNEALVQAMLESEPEPDPDAEPTNDLSGKPIRR